MGSYYKYRAAFQTWLFSHKYLSFWCILKIIKVIIQFKMLNETIPIRNIQFTDLPGKNSHIPIPQVKKQHSRAPQKPPPTPFQSPSYLLLRKVIIILTLGLSPPCLLYTVCPCYSWIPYLQIYLKSICNLKNQYLICFCGHSQVCRALKNFS